MVISVSMYQLYLLRYHGVLHWNYSRCCSLFESIQAFPGGLQRHGSVVWSLQQNWFGRPADWTWQWWHGSWSTLIGWSGGRMMPWKLLWGSRPALLFLGILISDPSFALGHVVRLVRLKIIQSALYCDSSLSPMKPWCNVGQFNEGAFRLNNYIIPSH